MEVLTAHDIADVLHLSYQTALAFIKNSGVRFFKIGKSYRVLASDFFEFLETTEHTEIDLLGISELREEKHK